MNFTLIERKQSFVQRLNNYLLILLSQQKGLFFARNITKDLTLMKLAITGASGKTGFRVAEEAISAGYEVRLIVRSQSEIPESIQRCERYVLSETNGTTLDYALQGCESLVIATGARPSIDLIGPAKVCLLYTSPSPRDGLLSRMPSSA